MRKSKTWILNNNNTNRLLQIDVWGKVKYIVLLVALGMLLVNFWKECMLRKNLYLRHKENCNSLQRVSNSNLRDKATRNSVGKWSESLHVLYCLYVGVGIVLIYGLICSTNKHCALRGLVVTCVCVWQRERGGGGNTGCRIEADVLKLRGNYVEVKRLTYD